MTFSYCWNLPLIFNRRIHVELKSVRCSIYAYLVLASLSSKGSHGWLSSSYSSNSDDETNSTVSAIITHASTRVCTRMSICRPRLLSISPWNYWFIHSFTVRRRRFVNMDVQINRHHDVNDNDNYTIFATCSYPITTYSFHSYNSYYTQVFLIYISLVMELENLKVTTSNYGMRNFTSTVKSMFNTKWYYRKTFV